MKGRIISSVLRRSVTTGVYGANAGAGAEAPHPIVAVAVAYSKVHYIYCTAQHNVD